MVAQVLREYGRIDILVNNAFISGGYALVTETSEETWDRVIAVNLKGYFNCAKAAAKAEHSLSSLDSISQHQIVSIANPY